MKIPTVVSIRRDPFGRGNVIRVSVAPSDRKACAWCGGSPGRFKYGWSDDGKAGLYFESESFCGVGCRNSYYGR